VDKWKTIPSDKSIFDAINGYQLNFHTLPPTKNNCNNPAFNEHEKTSIALEVQNILKKGIIETAMPCNYQFVTHIFTKPKKDGTHRVISNLKSLNDCIDNFNFKMDSLRTAINLMNKSFCMYRFKRCISQYSC
jgi:hypothetical protein